MKKETALELAKKYPNEIYLIPREKFEDQLANFIVKQKLKR